MHSQPLLNQHVANTWDLSYNTSQYVNIVELHNNYWMWTSNNSNHKQYVYSENITAEVSGRQSYL